MLKMSWTTPHEGEIKTIRLTYSPMKIMYPFGPLTAGPVDRRHAERMERMAIEALHHPDSEGDRKRLVIAAALLAAEIERLDRMERPDGAGGE
jgi:hypothetical protein